MKTLVFASFLGTAAGAYALPALAGPVHFQVTRPHSLFGTLPPATGQTTASVVLGQVPLDFILTDVMAAGALDNAVVTVNNTPVLCLPRAPGYSYVLPVHLSSGVFIPAGATIGFQVDDSGPRPSSAVTIAGYVQ